MLRAIGIYEIDQSNSSIHFIKTSYTAPRQTGFTFFLSDPLDAVEKISLAKLTVTDLDEHTIYHFSHQNEHHYLKKIQNTSFMIAICSRKILDPKEIGYLMINAQHAFEHPDSSHVTLDDMIMNPLGYINVDQLVRSSQNQLDEIKKILLENMDKLLERGETLDTTLNNTIQLDEMSTAFTHRTKELNRWCRGCW